MRLFLDCVARYGHTEIVNALLAARANVDAANNGVTPLHMAALSPRERGSPQPSAAPHARRRSARTAREAAD